jgi:hypothetical protein
MPKALMVRSGYRTAPSSTLTTVANATGDTFAVQNYYQGAAGYMLDAWADLDSQGVVQFKSPNFHDDVFGINQEVPAKTPTPVLPAWMRQTLQPNDTINALLSVTGAANPSGLTIIEYYTDLPGSNARLYRWEELVGSIVDFMSCTVDVAPGGTRGDYTGEAAINSLQDVFKASTDYALLGYTTSVQYQTVGIRGADTSNWRLGGPGTTPDIMDTRQWFIQLSEQSGLPCIPVLNSQNLNGTLVDVIDTENKGNGSISFFFARLNGTI